MKLQFNGCGQDGFGKVARSVLIDQDINFLLSQLLVQVSQNVQLISEAQCCRDHQQVDIAPFFVRVGAGAEQQHSGLFVIALNNPLDGTPVL